jgi:hypothetical protein
MSLRSVEEAEIFEYLKNVTTDAATHEEQAASADEAHTPTQGCPKLPEEALHGLAGEVVRTIEPHSEADTASLLLQLLVGFGSMVGRGVHTAVEADRHGCNLFCCVVGQSSKGRKGTSWGHIRRLLSQVDTTWADTRIQSGLSSGEGLIWSVRDPIEKRKGKKVGDEVTCDTFIEDYGEPDKRLLTIESEFASVLKTMERNGSTLSPLVRQAWDSGDLRVMTKNSPARATAAHISIIGHITEEELKRNLTSTEAANGFANRFLWVLSRRSKCLPEGGNIREQDLVDLARRLKDVANAARHGTQIQRDREAKDLWAIVYPRLSDGRPGLLGSVTNRAEAQVLRLSLLYAVLDGSDFIRVAHLKAALAAWEYCEQSARSIFGDSLGNEVADRILAELRSTSPHGLALTEISAIFGRNRNERAIRTALSELERHGFASHKKIPTGGRPIELWFARSGTN